MALADCSAAAATSDTRSSTPRAEVALAEACWRSVAPSLVVASTVSLTPRWNSSDSRSRAACASWLIWAA